MVALAELVGGNGAAWEQLALTSDALGLKLRALRASAEARAAVGDMVNIYWDGVPDTHDIPSWDGKHRAS